MSIGTQYGFWEFMNDGGTAGFSVQILTEDLDAGSILQFREVNTSMAILFKQMRWMMVKGSLPILAE
jgi:hypothetical protein